MIQRDQLFQRAREYRRRNIYLPDLQGYHFGLIRKPGKMQPYWREGWEPVVSTDGLYNVGDFCFCTVNNYNALVLNSKTMLIADIDFGDPRLSKWAGPAGIEQVLAHLKQLHLLDAECYTDFS